jgi:REP element-mobilizing transposase RayT
MDMSTLSHRPPHIYADDTWFNITAATVHHAHYLTSREHCGIWVDALRALVQEFKVTLRAWVVLPNHHHLLVKPQRGRDVARFLGRLHGRTSFELNKMGILKLSVLAADEGRGVAGRLLAQVPGERAPGG